MPQAYPIVERCKFYERYRQSGETVVTLLAEFRALADKCDFGEQLTVALRDRLVCRIADDRMQRRLLAEPYKGLELERVVDICKAMETVSKNVQRLQETKPVGPAVNTMSYSSEKQQRHKQQTGSKKGSCLRCGGSHKSDECRFKEAECNFCHKTGHLDKIFFAAK